MSSSQLTFIFFRGVETTNQVCFRVLVWKWSLEMVKFRVCATSKNHLEAWSDVLMELEVAGDPAAVTIWHLLAVVRCRRNGRLSFEKLWLFGSGASTVWPLIATENKIGKPTTSSWCRQTPDWMEVPWNWWLQLGTVYYNLFQKRSPRRFESFFGHRDLANFVGVSKVCGFPYSCWEDMVLHWDSRPNTFQGRQTTNKGESSYQICQNLGLPNIKWLLTLKPTFVFFCHSFQVPSAMPCPRPRDPAAAKCSTLAGDTTVKAIEKLLENPDEKREVHVGNYGEIMSSSWSR